MNALYKAMVEKNQKTKTHFEKLSLFQRQGERKLPVFQIAGSLSSVSQLSYLIQTHLDHLTKIFFPSSDTVLHLSDFSDDFSIALSQSIFFLLFTFNLKFIHCVWHTVKTQ